jgi:DNA-binding transcriptional LysR family regulator
MPRNDKRIDLNLFRVLDAIHAEGGIGAAARALHLTQPAVTHALNRLREHFGDPLFVRQGNRVVPTDQARAIIEDVRLHLKGLQDTTRRRAGFEPSRLQMEFTVGFRDILESIVFPRLLPRLEREAPQVRIASRRVPAGEVERELMAGSIDLVVDRSLKVGTHVVQEHLVDEGLAVVMRRGHPLDGTALRKTEYLAARHVAVSPFGEPAALDVLLGQDGRFRHIVLSCQHYFSAAQIAADSDLLLTMPRSYAMSVAGSLPISLHPLPIRLKPIPVRMYWHESKQGDRAHAWFRSVLSEAVVAAMPREAA